MEQTKALNALEPFLALSKSATSPRAAADLIIRATSAPGTFVFAELLDTPQIQALAGSPDFSSTLALLQIFSYGTYKTYASTAGLPPLNDAQRLKLRQLSVLTLARDQAQLTYAALAHSLGLDNDQNGTGTPEPLRALEDVVISAVYAGLVSAQLDPAKRLVRVSSVAPLRDLTPGPGGDIPVMISTLEAWSARCDATLADLEAQVAQIRKAAARRAADKREWDAAVGKLVDEERGGPVDGGKKGGGGGGAGGVGGVSSLLGGLPGKMATRYGKRAMEKTAQVDDDEAMDLDDEDGGAEDKKRASRRKLQG